MERERARNGGGERGKGDARRSTDKNQGELWSTRALRTRIAHAPHREWLRTINRLSQSASHCAHSSGACDGSAPEVVVIDELGADDSAGGRRLGVRFVPE